MFTQNKKFVVLCFLFAIFLLPATLQAGPIANTFTWIRETPNIRKHSRVICSEVRGLYRQRASIQRLADGSQTLVEAYEGIRDRSASRNIPQLLTIARGIAQVLAAYGELAPAAEQMYRNSQPSLQYFSGLANKTSRVRAGNREIVTPVFTDRRINGLSRSAGLSNVWKGIKKKPLNIFRWGRIRDDYRLGRSEAKYILKATQTAFEGSQYYFAVRENVRRLQEIKREIDDILGGDLGALIKIGATMGNVLDAASTVGELADIATEAPKRLGKRFDELSEAQEEYARIARDYNRKYEPDDAGTWMWRTSSSPAPSRMPSTTSRARDTTPVHTGSAVDTGNDLQQAMSLYQQTYEDYIALSQAPNVSPEHLQQALVRLQQARQNVENIRQQAR